MLSVAFPPQSGAAGPEEVALPHRCAADPATWSCSVVYRLGFRHSRPDEAGVSLYLPHFSGTLRIHLNGVLLADSRHLQPALYLGQGAPLLLPLPAPLLRPGDNELEIALSSERLFAGFLGLAFVGPGEQLWPHHSFARFAAVTLPRLIDGWMIAMGVFVLLIGLLRPNEQVYLVFGAMLLFFAGASLPAILLETPDDDLARLAGLSRLAGGALILPFVFLFVGRRPPLPPAAFLLLPLLAALCVFALPGAQGGWLLRFVLTPLMLLLALLATAVLAQAALRARGDEALLLLSTGSIALVFGVHDLLVLNGLLDGRHILLAHFNAPLMMFVVGAVLTWRFAAALAVMERFNLRLQQAVAAAEERLRESFAREQAQSRRAALEAERVRLMRDLHDGLGGHLVSILSLSELGGERRDEAIAQASRRALADLRLVVSSLEDVGDDLELMLGMFRERIEPQLRAAGMALEWRLQPLPELPGLNPTATLTIFRVLQEAATNAVRHAGASRLAIEAEPSPSAGFGVRLTVRDYGHGGAGARARGLGMTSMAERSAALGARLTIDSGPEGTAVMLDLPPRIGTPPS